MSQHLLLLSSARRNGVSIRIRANVGSITFFEHKLFPPCNNAHSHTTITLVTLQSHQGSECLLLKPGRSKRRYMSQHLLLLSSARRNGVSVRIRATVGSITFFEHTFHRYRTHYMHGRNTLLLTIPRLYSAGLLLTIPRLYSAGLHTSINNFMSLSKHSAQHGDRSSSNWQCTAI